MKYTNPWIAAAATLVCAASILSAAPSPQVQRPRLDGGGRFWVYRNGPTEPRMPFAPYGWMSDASNATRVIKMDLQCPDDPCTAIQPPTPERPFCIRVTIDWDDATWAGVAFISGPSDPPWWGDTRAGWHFDLSALPKKKLVFYARGAKGGEVIKVNIGGLGDKPYGDSLINPITSQGLKLTPDWTRFELDLNSVPPSELTNICNGFSVLAKQASQPGAPAETQFYLDNIYFE